MTRRGWLISIVVVLVVGAAWVVWPRGVKVEVANVGAGAMRDVRVVVTGAEYGVGDVGPGQSGAVRVRPTGESGVVVRYADEGGGERSVGVDCYIEPGYAGRIRVEVADGTVVKVENRVRARGW